MARKWFLLSIVLLFIPCLVFGCGVGQEQYDAVVAERGNAQQELQTVKAELGKTKIELATAKANLDKAMTELAGGKIAPQETDLDRTKAELAVAKSDLEKKNTELDRLKGELESKEEQTIRVNSVWSSLKPKVEVLLIIMESIETIAIKRLTAEGGTFISQQEYGERTTDQKKRIAVALEATGNDKLTETLLGKESLAQPHEHLQGAWDTGAFGSKDAGIGSSLGVHWTLWRNAARISIDLTKQDVEDLSNQFGP